MKIYSETALRDFHFWAGGSTNAHLLSYEELDTIEEILEDTNPDGMSDTDINDLFWFETEWLAEILGYNNWEDIVEEREW